MSLQTRGLFVDTAGNVGIGETSPSAKLDVVGTTELNRDVTINSNLPVDTDTLVVDGTTGNVRIGATTPSDAILDVEGDVRINDNDLFLRAASDNAHGVGWYGVGKEFAGSDHDGAVLFGHGDGRALRQGGAKSGAATARIVSHRVARFRRRWRKSR